MTTNRKPDLGSLWKRAGDERTYVVTETGPKIVLVTEDRRATVVVTQPETFPPPKWRPEGKLAGFAYLDSLAAWRRV